MNLGKLTKPHTVFGSISWHLTAKGLVVDGKVETTGGKPATVRRIWKAYANEITAAADRYSVPVELIIATAATESSGKARALRKEPGYKSDAVTPNRVSPGIMQTLISTARSAMGDTRIDREWLYEPRNSFMAGTAYIGQQKGKTDLDPPKVACAYNAGSIYEQKGRNNRWKMRQYPIGTGEHADRFVKWFNDCLRMFDADGGAPAMSFHAMLNAPDDGLEDLPVAPPGPMREPGPGASRPDSQEHWLTALVKALVSIFRR